MKKLIFLINIIPLIITLGCASVPEYDSQKLSANQKRENEFTRLQQEIPDRGYVTTEELQQIFKLFQEEYLLYAYSNHSLGYDLSPSKKGEVLIEIIIERDLLPYKPMFYLALEEENYEEAEYVRRVWVGSLTNIAALCEKKTRINQFPYTHCPCPLLSCSKFRIKLDYEIEKLTSVVGITDLMLLTCRKELMLALKNKKWDEVQKLQNIITARVNELRPSQPQLIYKEAPGGQTTVVVQQPSEQHISVERIPRYGATDVGRAISLLQGKGGGLTDKEAGTLKLLDILMKR
jgi:hypothetical protein